MLREQQIWCYLRWTTCNRWIHVKRSPLFMIISFKMFVCSSVNQSMYSNWWKNDTFNTPRFYPIKLLPVSVMSVYLRPWSTASKQWYSCTKRSLCEWGWVDAKRHYSSIICLSAIKSSADLKHLSKQWIFFFWVLLRNWISDFSLIKAKTGRVGIRKGRGSRRWQRK